MPQDNQKQPRQMDDNIDDLGRRPDGTKQEQTTHDQNTPDAVEKAVEVSRKIGLQRPYKKDSDVSGGFNQKSR